MNPISPGFTRKKIDGNHTLEELSWIGKINLRGNPKNEELLKKINQSIECELPLKANTLSMKSGVTVFWLGPNEWMIYCDITKTSYLFRKLKNKLSGIHYAVTDLSDYYTVLQLSGPQAGNLLNKCCPLNMNVDAFPLSTCVQTRFGHASLFIYKLHHVSVFYIQVKWSYTEYVWDYLKTVINYREL